MHHLMSPDECVQSHPSSDIGPLTTHEPTRHMVSEINPAELPNELLDISVTAQMPFRNGF